ncbi:MAG: restriction endonuclease subunit S [Parcubacteria group bacterium]|nr:restriction endonuclease subunit S [Parcubacteria group bacterium]
MKNSFPTKKLGDLEDTDIIKLGRGNVISKNDIEETPGDYPIYSSSQQNEGEFGRYGKFMFDEELITWSVDGGGQFFYRPEHKYSVTNVCGWLRVLKSEILNCKFLYYTLYFAHKKLNFDYTFKAHPSVIRKMYKIPLPPLQIQKQIVERLDKIVEAQKLNDNLIQKSDELFQSLLHKELKRILLYLLTRQRN